MKSGVYWFRKGHACTFEGLTYGDFLASDTARQQAKGKRQNAASLLEVYNIGIFE